MKILIILVCMAFLNACAGVKFADERVNKNLPEDFKKRNIYPETDIFKYKLDSLVGRILVCKPGQVSERVYDCDLKITRILKTDSATNQPIPPETITPERIVYSSKIDRGAAAQGSYLTFAGSFSAEQVAELLITDSSLVFANDNDVPVSEILNYVSSNPKQEGEERFWIQGALLATLIQRDLVKIKSDAEGVVGNTSGVKGEVYNNRGQESIDYRISLLMPNIDRDFDEIQEVFVESAESKQGIILNSISGLDTLPEVK